MGVDGPMGPSRVMFSKPTIAAVGGFAVAVTGGPLGQALDTVTAPEPKHVNDEATAHRPRLSSTSQC